MSKPPGARQRKICDFFPNKREASRWASVLKKAGVYSWTGPYGHPGSAFRWEVLWYDHDFVFRDVSDVRVAKLTKQVVRAVELRTKADERASKRNVHALEQLIEYHEQALACAVYAVKLANISAVYASLVEALNVLEAEPESAKLLLKALEEL